jgi:hypothetical protein
MIKKTAKPKKKKIIVPKLETPAIPSQPEEIVASLTAMKETSVGWQIVVSIIKENIRLLDQQIIKKVDTEGIPLTDAEVDHLRDLRNINEEVMNTPDGYIEDLTKDTQEDSDPDPYEKAKETKD